jgi:hypothetical protein
MPVGLVTLAAGFAGALLCGTPHLIQFLIGLGGSIDFSAILVAILFSGHMVDFSFNTENHMPVWSLFLLILTLSIRTVIVISFSQKTIYAPFLSGLYLN